MYLVEIISIGDELLNGTVVDTNGAWLGQQLHALGARVTRRQVVADRVEAIAQALETASLGTHLVVTSGGLGPTSDDVTAAAYAAWLGTKPTLNTEAMAQIVAWRKTAGRKVLALDRRQAMLPPGAEVLPNRVGTAPGFAVTRGQGSAIAVPGVPRELKALFADHIAPRVRAAIGRRSAGRTWKFFGLTESQLAARVESMEVSGHELHYRAQFPEIHLSSVATSATTLDHLEGQLYEAVGAHYFGGADDTLAGVLNAALERRGETVATAESCTGGLVAQHITAVPGSSAVFQFGWVTYANAAKERELGVPHAMLKEYGAVSREVVEAMARGARIAANGTYGIATSGIAGPGGGTAQRPVGTVHIAVASPTSVHHRQFQFSFDRERTRVVTAHAALALLWRLIRDAERTESPIPSTEEA